VAFVHSTAPAWSHPAKAPPRLLVTVQARIKAYVAAGVPKTSLMAPLEVSFSPDLIDVGTVIIAVNNTTNESHALEIDGVSTALLGPGGRADIRVNFRRPAKYTVSVSADDPVPISGTLTVIK
jgi:hypothetical protein